MNATVSATPGEPLPAEVDAAWEVRVRWSTLLRQRLRGNYQLFVGLALLAGFVAVGLGEALAYGRSLDQLAIVPAYANNLYPPGPSWAHPFGIDTGVGIDLFPAVLQATPIDLALVGGSIILAALLGLFVGAYAGLAGGVADGIVTAAGDVVVGVPPFFLVLVLFLGLQPFTAVRDYLLLFGLLFVAVLWPYHARPVRARAQQVAAEPYIESARAAGATPARLLWRHIIPNSIYPIFAQLPIDVYNFLFVLTVFPFLGCFGGGAGGLYAYLTPLPATVYPEWGLLLASGACYGWSPLAEVNFWWMYAFPAATIVLFGIAVTLACDGFERYLTGIRRPT